MAMPPHLPCRQLQAEKTKKVGMIKTFPPLRFFFTPSHKPYLLSAKPHHSSLSLSSSSMENSSTTLLYLHGKSPLETNFAQSLKTNNTLSLLPDSQPSILLHHPTTFNITSYLNSLSTNLFGRFIIHSPHLSSTQDLISKNFKHLPIGTVCIADTQFKGRGRSRNQWESPKGSLLFSFTLQMEDGRIVPLLQYVVCLSVTESIKHLCISKGFPFLDLRIKWPNDVYLNGVKIGGILCSSTYSEKKFNVSVGVGLNLDNEMPTTCLNKVLSELSPFSSCKLTREEILAGFFVRFESLYDVFVNQGFRALEEMYCRAWLHSGQRVVIQEKNSEGLVEEIGVTIQGLTSSGYLLAIDDDNHLYELHPDGNSLDFFNGLVRRKLE